MGATHAGAATRAGERTKAARKMGTIRSGGEGGVKQPGRNAPEIPRTPRPEPELPGRTGAPPGREIAGIPRPEPELPPRVPRRPEAPFDPTAPGQ